MTNFRDGFQQLGPESLQVFWCLLQTGEGIHSQLFSTALFIIRFIQEMSIECLLHTRHRLHTVDTPMTQVKVSASCGGFQWAEIRIKQRLCIMAGCSVKGSPLALHSWCVCCLDASFSRECDPRAAFPGKMFMFQNFPDLAPSHASMVSCLIPCRPCVLSTWVLAVPKQVW